MAVVVKDANMAGIRTEPMGVALPRSGGPFRQRADAFGSRNPQREAAAPSPARIRVMARAIPADAAPESSSLGQEGGAPGQLPPATATIIIVALAVGVVILLAD